MALTKTRSTNSFVTIVDTSNFLSLRIHNCQGGLRDEEVMGGQGGLRDEEVMGGQGGLRDEEVMLGQVGLRDEDVDNPESSVSSRHHDDDNARRRTSQDNLPMHHTSFSLESNNSETDSDLSPTRYNHVGGEEMCRSNAHVADELFFIKDLRRWKLINNMLNAKDESESSKPFIDPNCNGKLNSNHECASSHCRRTNCYEGDPCMRSQCLFLQRSLSDSTADRIPDNESESSEDSCSTLNSQSTDELSHVTNIHISGCTGSHKTIFQCNAHSPGGADEMKYSHLTLRETQSCLPAHTSHVTLRETQSCESALRRPSIKDTLLDAESIVDRKDFLRIPINLINGSEKASSLDDIHLFKKDAPNESQLLRTTKISQSDEILFRGIENDSRQPTEGNSLNKKFIVEKHINLCYDPSSTAVGIPGETPSAPLPWRGLRGIVITDENHVNNIPVFEITSPKLRRLSSGRRNLKCERDPNSHVIILKRSLSMEKAQAELYKTSIRRLSKSCSDLQSEAFNNKHIKSKHKFSPKLQRLLFVKKSKKAKVNESPVQREYIEVTNNFSEICNCLQKSHGSVLACKVFREWAGASTDSRSQSSENLPNVSNSSFIFINESSENSRTLGPSTAGFDWNKRPKSPKLRLGFMRKNRSKSLKVKYINSVIEQYDEYDAYNNYQNCKFRNREYAKSSKFSDKFFNNQKNNVKNSTNECSLDFLFEIANGKSLENIGAVSSNLPKFTSRENNSSSAEKTHPLGFNSHDSRDDNRRSIKIQPPLKSKGINFQTRVSKPSRILEGLPRFWNSGKLSVVSPRTRRKVSPRAEGGVVVSNRVTTAVTNLTVSLLLSLT